MRLSSEVDFQSRQIGEGNNRSLASLIGGIDTKLDDLDDAARELNQAGYDVVSYAFSADVITCGDPYALVELVSRIESDFEPRTQDYRAQRHSGVSLGSGIAWNLQKNEAIDTHPGIYASVGVDLGRLIMKNLAFRAIVKFAFKKDITNEYKLKGYDEHDIKEIQKKIQAPPETGFAMALGSWDPTTKYKEAVDIFADRTGTDGDVRLVTLPRLGHSGTNTWFLSNIPAMIGAADSTIK